MLLEELPLLLEMLRMVAYEMLKKAIGKIRGLMVVDFWGSGETRWKGCAVRCSNCCFERAVGRGMEKVKGCTLVCSDT